MPGAPSSFLAPRCKNAWQLVPSSELERTETTQSCHLYYYEDLFPGRSRHQDQMLRPQPAQPFSAPRRRCGQRRRAGNQRGLTIWSERDAVCARFGRTACSLVQRMFFFFPFGVLWIMGLKPDGNQSKKTLRFLIKNVCLLLGWRPSLVGSFCY